MMPRWPTLGGFGRFRTRASTGGGFGRKQERAFQQQSTTETAPPPIEIAKPLPAFKETPVGEPIRVNLQELAPEAEIVAGQTFNVVAVREESVSALAEPYDPENPFVTIDDRGNIEYTPRGTYLWNVLEIEVDPSDASRVLASPQRQMRGVYQDDSESLMEEETDSEGIPLEFVEVDGSNPAKRTFKLVVEEDVIGDPDAAETFFQHQGNDGTCLAVSTGASLESLGTVDANGNPVTVDTVLDDLIRVYGWDDDKQRLFIVKDSTIKDPNGNPYYAEVLEGGQIIPVEGGAPGEEQYVGGEKNQDGVWPTGIRTHAGMPILQRMPAAHRARESVGWLIVKDIAEHYGVTPRESYATSFTTLIHELEAGNPVVASVDATELWNDPTLLEDYQAAADRNFQDATGNQLLSNVNHAVWITGIDLSIYETTGNPDHILIVINDSGPASGASNKYVLTQFLAAWEDAEFGYYSFGDEPDLPGKADTVANNKRAYDLRLEMRQVQHFEAGSRIDDILQEHANDNSEYSRWRSRFGAAQIASMPEDARVAVLNEMEKFRPGFIDDYKEWLANELEAQKEVEIDYGIPLDEISKIQDEVDLE